MNKINREGQNGERKKEKQGGQEGVREKRHLQKDVKTPLILRTSDQKVLFRKI